jgi:lysophospholipase
MNKEIENSKIYSDLDFELKDVDRYISQSNYEEEMSNKIEPYLKEKLKKGHILGVNDIKLYYEKYIVENPKASIVICHGFGEFSEKYNEIIYYFMREGYSVFVLEHRGHGRSQRLGVDDYQINVERFNYYVDDFKRFIDEIVVRQSDNKNLFLFAHSMGGAIGTVFLEAYTEYFKAAVLSSPMYEINTGKIPKALANAVAEGMKFFGKGINYLPGQLPYRDKKVFSSRSTSCKERYNYLQDKIRNNSCYHSGGSSAIWYLESLKATKKLIKKENVSKVKIPVLLFQAEHDTHVIPRAQNKFSVYAKNCELIYVKGSKHEAYFERDEISLPFFDKVLSFYERNI